ncbi:neuronal acetylcholine receptor subunit alpha-2-like [Physella acuta]|uniref:neuronal acetylcholine receptor subunit alpha-2-like n=1 Tax=Physella acuta TaxID=109671 RepID=UPI0027DEA34C|nr:neuronal acetylcholine receptor subunit alpha-2-like [Physella acuta]
MAAVTFLVWLLMSVTVTSQKTKEQLAKEDKEFDDELNITSKEKLLVKRLISRYQRMGKEGRPVVNTSDAVRVDFGLSLIQILDVDVKDQVLKTNVWYEYTWQDVLLRWDVEEYDNITDVRIPSSNIWLPDILLYNFADDRLQEQRNALVVVNHNGALLWMPQAILRSSCAFDTLYFPFDEQTCVLKFGSWTYNGFKLDIHFISGRQQFELTDYIENNEWTIIENSGHRNIKKYTCCPEPYPDLKFKLVLRRRVAFYTFILIMPCALLSLLTMVIFWVPPESPAKLTLGMNIFLAFFVLLLLLAESTPKAASTIPLIGAYFCMNMIMITLSEILACVVANMHFRGVRINRVPKCLRVFMINFMARILCITDQFLEKENAPVVAGPPKKRWNAGRVGGDTNRPQYPYTDISFAQVRLLDNGAEKRQQEQDMCGGGGGNGLDGRGGPGFAFPPIGDEYLSHSQSNLQVLEEVKAIRDMLEKVREKKAKAAEKDKIYHEWRVVGLVTDRVIFSFYVVTNFVGLMIIFIWQIKREPPQLKGFGDES